MIPKLDKRTKEDIMDEVERLAAAYTPQWRYNRLRPDIGSVLADLYAELMEECIVCYNQMPLKTRLSFLDALGVEPFPARPAEGHLVFSLAARGMPETVVEAGTGVSVECDNKSLLRFETLEEVYVSDIAAELVRSDGNSVWYVGFDRPPNRGVISLLFSVGWQGGPGAGGIKWEYLAPDGWRPLSVEDETNGLSHSGIVRFLCMSEWKREMRAGMDACWLRIVRESKRPFPGGDAGVSVNAATVRAKMPGTEGNLLPGGPYKLAKTVGYVAGARNPAALYGGTKEEETERAVIRGSARIRHQFRAVTPGDFERLVYEIWPDVLQVKCFAGYGGDGKRSFGSVTVVILPSDFRSGRQNFYKMQELVKSYLERHGEGLLCRNGSLFVTQPVPVRIRVRCDLAVGSYREAAGTRRLAEETLRRFLDPVCGNHDGGGWDMGEVPDYDQIKACLLAIPGVCCLSLLRMSCEIETENGFCEALWETLGAHPWVLPEPGECKITVTVNERMEAVRRCF